MLVVFILMVSSIMVVQPNEAKAITFFGSYIGSVRESGLWMTVPFTNKPKVSLRVRNFNSKMLKVNDIEGNPTEIASAMLQRQQATAIIAARWPKGQVNDSGDEEGEKTEPPPA